MPLPKKGVAYTFTLVLLSQANPGSVQVNPTLASGDFKISKDGNTFNNLATLPTVSPSGGAQVLVSLSPTEMTADTISILAVDVAGAEWGDYYNTFDTTIQTVDDIPTANANADALLKRDWTAVSGSPATYSVWNALRALRNVWTLVAGAPPVWHIKDEGGSTDAWTRNVTTDAAANPITGVS